MELTRLASIIGIKAIKDIVFLNKGWSKDKKYIITDTDNNKFLLRISHITLYEKKKEQFTILKEIEKLNIYAPKPISFGKLSDDEVFILLTWLEGEDAEVIIPTLTDQEAYELGIQAGQDLKSLHQVSIKKPFLSWHEIYLAKMERKIQVFNECKEEIPYRDTLIDYMKKNIKLTENRPQLFSHGDFHVGNMIIKEGKIGIVDFDKNKPADPYDDFKPFCWNVYASEFFATGLINGYFANNIPDDFFPILALYAVESLISHLPWALDYGTDEVKIAYQVMHDVMRWYNNFTTIVPVWYKGIIR